MNGTRLALASLALVMLAGCDESTSPTALEGQEEEEAQPQAVTVPKLISPAYGAVMDNGCQDRSNGIVWDFEWSEVDEAVEYHLYVKGVNASIAVVDDVVVGKQYRHDSPGSYIIGRHQLDWRWRVRARIGLDWQDWSDENSFDVEPLDTDCS